MSEKAVYSLTEAGEAAFEQLMLEIASMPVRVFLEFNAVIVNLPGLTPDKQQLCLTNIERNVKELKSYLEENLLMKENVSEIPETGMAVLQQQLILADAIENWIVSLKRHDNL